MLIRESAARIAGHRWFEERLFELTGAWAAEGGDPAVTRLLATQSRHHGWRASVWAEVEPVLHDVPPAPPVADDVALLDVLGGEADRSIRFAGLTSVVLPHLIERYVAHGASATEMADAPVTRALRLVLADARADQQAAEVVRSSLEVDDVVRLAAHRSELERLLQ